MKLQDKSLVVNEVIHKGNEPFQIEEVEMENAKEAKLLATTLQDRLEWTKLITLRLDARERMLITQLPSSFPRATLLLKAVIGSLIQFLTRWSPSMLFLKHQEPNKHQYPQRLKCFFWNFNNQLDINIKPHKPSKMYFVL